MAASLIRGATGGLLRESNINPADGGMEMSDEKVKLPRSSYDELCKIIIAYGRLEKPSTLDHVNTLAGVGKTVVSANNAFLSFIGFIEGGKAKQATELGKKLAQALEFDVTDQVQSAWKGVVDGNEFLRKMALALRIRKTMEESAFVSHVAYSAGEPKSGYAMTGARAVIDILRASGLVEESDGKLTSTETPEASDIPSFGKPTITVRPPRVSRPLATSFDGEVPSSAPSVRIEVRIDAKPSELDDLAPRLKRFLKALAEGKANDVDEGEEGSM